MPEEKTPQEKADELPRAKGKGTLILEAQAAAEERAEKRRKEERERDKEQEADKDRWAERALATAEGRAEAAESQVASLHKRYGMIIALLVLAVIGLAGYRVAGNLLKGQVDIGGPAEQVPD
jgi:hypothetical protein